VTTTDARRVRLGALSLLVVLFCGCAVQRAPSSGAAARSGAGTSEAPPAALLWARTAAEHHAAYLQAYRVAGERVRAQAARHRRGTWGVILDIDETVLDNSTFELEQQGKPSDANTIAKAFIAWCRREEARALPGAKGLLDLVRSLGGRIALVTNRPSVVCDETRDNLKKEDLVFDEVLCNSDGDDKNARFQAVQSGTPPSTLPAFEVVLWVGDNIQDFPALTQATMRDAGDAAFVEFGGKYLVLPNPMYGSWTKNPMH
jgi:5'-nucleotidase (lipoprotein e(P4) family)